MAVLEWAICTSCRHVHLDQWSFLDADDGEERPEVRRVANT